MYTMQNPTWLSQYRQAQGMTQKQVAEAAGLHRSAYCNIESGRRRPSVELAKRIATVIGFDWTKFFE